MFKWLFNKQKGPVHIGPVELPTKVLNAIEETTIAPRQSGLLIIGLGSPFFYESINVTVRARFTEYGLDEQQLELAANILRQQIKREVREMKKAIRAEKRRERSPWSNSQRLRH